MCAKSRVSQVWGVVTKLEDPKDYIMAADIWVEYPVKYFAAREVSQRTSPYILTRPHLWP
jgi:hypothetical protein